MKSLIRLAKIYLIYRLIPLTIPFIVFLYIAKDFIIRYAQLALFGQ